MNTKYTNKCQFPNLKQFGNIKEMELIPSNYADDGIKLLLENEKEATETEVYVLFDGGSAWYEVQLPNGSYNVQFVYVSAHNEQNALDRAVDFLIDQGIAFDHCDFYEAQDNDMVDENGEVIDSICCGNEGIYVPCTVVINREEN